MKKFVPLIVVVLTGGLVGGFFYLLSTASDTPTPKPIVRTVVETKVKTRDVKVIVPGKLSEECKQLIDDTRSAIALLGSVDGHETAIQDAIADLQTEIYTSNSAEIYKLQEQIDSHGDKFGDELTTLIQMVDKLKSSENTCAG